MHFETFEDIIAYAVEKEKEAAAFYEDLAGREKFSGNKDTFAAFAQEERKHRQMLDNFGRENVEEYKLQKIPDLKRSDYIVDLKYEPGMSYSDILKLAMKREEKALKFYNDFADKIHNQEHRKLFQVLAQEEAKHKLRLETFLDDYMEKMGD